MDEDHPLVIELKTLTSQSSKNRTAETRKRMSLIESELGLWLDENNRVTIPPQALRACIETAARRLRQGTAVREGLTIDYGVKFLYDGELGEEPEEVAENAAYKTDVVVQRSRVLRTRPRFNEWACVFVVDVDDELVDQSKLENWLSIAGRRIGLGDWRPEKSGVFGKFEVKEIKVLEGESTELPQAA